MGVLGRDSGRKQKERNGEGYHVGVKMVQV